MTFFHEQLALGVVVHFQELFELRGCKPSDGAQRSGESQSAGCLGDAMIAAVGVGIYKDFEEAAEHMVRVDKEYLPNMEAHEQYKFYMDRYMEVWPQMKEIVHKTVDHNAN